MFRSKEKYLLLIVIFVKVLDLFFRFQSSKGYGFYNFYFFLLIDVIYYIKLKLVQWFQGKSLNFYYYD